MELPSPPADLVFEIAYQEFAGRRYKRDFRGRGTLRVQAGGAEFVFTGGKRGLFASRTPVERRFAATQIRNVVVAGCAVQFAVAAEAPGGKAAPAFVFFARTAEEAVAIAALLPATQEEDFVAAQEFIARLVHWHGPADPWRSVTSAIIAANVLMFLFMGLQGAGWFEVASMEPYLHFGANRADITTDGQWWRLVACMFIHYGAIHLLLNMSALFQTGQLVEKLFGRGLFALAYFGSGIAGSLTTLLWHREKLVLSAGASGAVFGIYGALLGYLLHEKHTLPKSVYQPFLKSTLLFAAYNLVFGLIYPGIDNAAHLGGFAGGGLLGWLLAVPVEPAERRRLAPRRWAAGLAAVGVIVAGGVAAAPHFSYRLEDEVAWERMNQAPAAKELAIAKQQQAAFAAYERDHDWEKFAAWLEREGVPFYAGWRDAAAALALTPGRATAERREIFVRVLTLQAESLQHLAAALRRGDEAALAHYAEDEARTNAELAKITARRK